MQEGVVQAFSPLSPSPPPPPRTPTTKPGGALYGLDFTGVGRLTSRGALFRMREAPLHWTPLASRGPSSKRGQVLLDPPPWDTPPCRMRCGGQWEGHPPRGPRGGGRHLSPRPLPRACCQRQGRGDRWRASLQLPAREGSERRDAPSDEGDAPLSQGPGPGGGRGAIFGDSGWATFALSDL